MTYTRTVRRPLIGFSLVLTVAAFLAVLFAGPGFGSGTEKNEGGTKKADDAAAYYNQGMKLVEDGVYETARKQFEKAVAQNPNDPDALNMLAFTQRKTGQIDNAFANYAKALRLRPDFPQAREYLAEAHIQAALQQIETLKGYENAGKKEWAEAVIALRQAAAQFDKMDTSAAGAEGAKKKW